MKVMALGDTIGTPEGSSFRDRMMRLPADIKKLMPDENIGYYETTDQMHCGPGEGGSKFEDPSVKNIIDVVEKKAGLAKLVEQRTDDREALRAAGAPGSAFLPAVKGPGAPEGLPEALYYKVEGIKGRLGIIPMKDLDDGTRVLVRREKGKRDPKGKGYVPVSFTVVRGRPEDMPKTDFATVIVGREGGEEGSNSVWTVHPGPPVRPAMKEFSWTEALPGPEEVGEGERQAVMVMTVKDLKEKAQMSPEDFVKIVPGDLDEALEKYDVRG